MKKKSLLFMFARNESINEWRLGNEEHIINQTAHYLTA